MGVQSKLHETIIRHRQCYDDLLHTGGCGRFALRNAYRFPYSNLIYFAPIIFVPLLLKLKKLDGLLLRKTFKYYLNCVGAGSTVGLTIASLICIFRQLFSEFKFYGFLFAPTLIGSLWTYFFGPQVLHLYQTSSFQGAFEAYLNTRSNRFTKLIASSVTLQCWIFMCCSALILHARQNGFLRGFWFLKPSPSVRSKRVFDAQQTTTTRTTTICTHAEPNCLRNLIKGVRTYAMIGTSVDILRMIMSPVTASKQLGVVEKLLAKTQNFRFQSTALFVSYMAIYRFTQCYLNRKFTASPELNHVLAAFLGGISYVFYPKQALLSYGLVLATPVLWQIITDHDAFEHNEALARLKAIPFANLLYPFALAYLVHMYIYDKNSVKGMSVSIINGLTDSYAKRIQTELYSVLSKD